jgi:hypothetical protein
MTKPDGYLDPNDLNFSIHDFKKWMTENARNEFALHPQKKGIGVLVEPRVSLSRVIKRMDAEDGEAEDMAKEFIENGGKILEIDGSLYLIEVTNGTFIIPRACVRKRQD